ncbi:hypothetical protein RJ55_05459 [Drechmeria coniospora]|nr:hypothetical protein RJ55_05459 [Drechmeria coniospora]
MGSARLLVAAFLALVGIANAQAYVPASLSLFAVYSISSVSNVGVSNVYGSVGVGSSSVSGFPPGNVIGGAIYVPPAGELEMVESDVIDLFFQGLSAVINADLSGQNLGGMTLGPGGYSFTADAALTGTLVLDGQNDDGSQWIFEVFGNLIAADSARIVLINGALSCNIFWSVVGSVVIGSQATTRGTVSSIGTISLGEGAFHYGGLYSISDKVSLDSGIVVGCRATYDEPTTTTDMMTSSTAVTDTTMSLTHLGYGCDVLCSQLDGFDDCSRVHNGRSNDHGHRGYNDQYCDDYCRKYHGYGHVGHHNRGHDSYRYHSLHCYGIHVGYYNRNDGDGSHDYHDYGCVGYHNRGRNGYRYHNLHWNGFHCDGFHCYYCYRYYSDRSYGYHGHHGYGHVDCYDGGHNGYRNYCLHCYGCHSYNCHSYNCHSYNCHSYNCHSYNCYRHDSDGSYSHYGHHGYGHVGHHDHGHVSYYEHRHNTCRYYILHCNGCHCYDCYRHDSDGSYGYHAYHASGHVSYHDRRHNSCRHHGFYCYGFHSDGSYGHHGHRHVSYHGHGHVGYDDRRHNSYRYYSLYCYGIYSYYPYRHYSIYCHGFHGYCCHRYNSDGSNSYHAYGHAGY